MINALIVDDKDDVAVAIEAIKKGDLVTYRLKNGEEQSLQALQDITIYHKIAVRDISKGQKVMKYGEHIGEATCDIKKGEHVHVQNLQGVRENLEV